MGHTGTEGRGGQHQAAGGACLLMPQGRTSPLSVCLPIAVRPLVSPKCHPDLVCGRSPGHGICTATLPLCRLLLYFYLKA